MLKSYEGLVGCCYPQYGVYVTSPNMETLPHPPLLGIHRIRLRKQLHYGEHDSCYVPQPFNVYAPHLALIPFPGSETLFAGDLTLSSQIAWALPCESEFQPLDGHKLSSIPLGFIPKHYATELKFLYNHLPTHSNLTSDHKILDYCMQFRHLLEQLSSPATFMEALMVWQISQ